MTENTNIESTEPTTDLEEGQELEETTEDQLLSLPAEKLVGLLRDKRKAEATVRAKLRETEAERDKLTGSVSAFQRQAFAEAAKGHQMQETALDDVLGAVELSEVLGEDGTVDAEKVGPALGELRKSKPHYFQTAVPRTRPDVNAASVGSSPAEASWGDVLG